MDSRPVIRAIIYNKRTVLKHNVSDGGAMCYTYIMEYM
jgi:hypothetical protein